MEKKHPGKLFIRLLTILTTVLLLAGIWVFWQIPSITNIPDNLAVPSIRILDRKGRTLYEVLDSTGGRNTPVPIESIPSALKLATIATEDQNFYSNPGVDIVGIIRAFWINLQGGETLAGGSTITQQVARNLLLSESEQFERTIRRKLRESWLAWQLTRNYTKDEILGLYLNQIYYGGFAYGVEAASQTYFGTPVKDLNLAQCALIAGIPQSPAIYNPLGNPAAAKNRQLIVLELMHNQGFITRDEYQLAIKEPLKYAPVPYPMEAPHFVMMVNSELDNIISPEIRRSKIGLEIRTSLDLDLQYIAEGAITRHLDTLGNITPTIFSGTIEQGHKVPGGHNVNNAALVALDPDTGEILSMVGSPDYFDPAIAGAINMATTPRQPGSALKPLIYAASFSTENPFPFTPATMILDVKTTFTTGDDNAYVPANFDNKFHGPVSVRQALASSLNIPAVITLEHIGLDTFFEFGSKLGITTLGNPDDYDLSLALGGGEVTLLELSAAYSVFANTGFKITPVSILEISTQNGDILYQDQAQTPVRLLDERIAWLISDILSDNQARSIGFGPHSILNLDRPAAVKTGTTTNFHDNWTIGYTPNLVAGVWVGNANHEPMLGVTGLSGAGPIWHQFMREALTGSRKLNFERPKGLRKIRVCALSGLLPTADCPYNKTEWFLAGTEPFNEDNIFNKVWIDTETGILANELTPMENRILVTALDLPPQAHQWVRDEGLLLLSDISEAQQNHNWNEFSLKILSPPQKAVYHLNSNIGIQAQKLHIQVATNVRLDQIIVWLDGKQSFILKGPPYETWWPLEIGEHTLIAESELSGGEILKSPIIQFRVEANE